MAQKVKLVDGIEKALADCTLADIEAKAEGAQPATTIGNNVSSQAMYAALAKKLRDAEGAKVADLGDVEVERWEQNLKLRFGSTKDAILRLFRKAPKTDGSSKEE